MIVTRKYFDAASAVSAGVGVALIAVGIKPVPAVIGFLGVAAVGWGALMALGCAGAATGALLRCRGGSKAAIRRRVWSVRLERISWPAIGLASIIFGMGIVHRVGILNGALSLGWAGFVTFTCIGHWLMVSKVREE